MTTSIAVLGYGYWGPNVVRNFSRLPNTKVTWVCDLNPKLLTDIPRLYPTIRMTTDSNEVLKDQETNAVVIATPPSTHFALAKKALIAGLHVLVEKPMTQTVAQANTLVALAKKKKRMLMVDHTFIYTPAVRKLASLIASKQMGQIYYVDSVRTNLGLFQKDSNVIADLATHDFSIMDYLFGRMPATIAATGITQQDLRQEAVSHIAAHYPGNLFLHCHVSWLSPVKIRRMIFVGTKKMCVYDDIEPSEKLKIYDKGISVVKDPRQSYQMRIGYRSGSVVVPHIGIEEGLFGMAGEFVRAIQTGRAPRTDGRQGARVVECLEAATASMRKGGKRVRV